MHSGTSFLLPIFSLRTLYDVAFSYDPEDPTSPKKTGWLVLSGHDDPDPSHFIVRESFDKFVLDMMGSLVLAEEKSFGFVSALRMFGRCDVSIYRDISSGRYQYVVNEVTRSYSTCLFEPWCDPPGIVDIMMARFLHVLQSVATSKFLSGQPPPPPIPH